VLTSLPQLTQSRLISLRWLSVLGMFLAALVSPQVLGSADLMPRLLAFATLIGCLNACLLVAAAIAGKGTQPLFSPFIQLAFDLVAWSAYLYLSGGATNPLISIFLPLVAIGASVLSRLAAWAFGAAAIVAYSFLWRSHVPLPIHDAERATYLHLLGMWLVFVVSALVVIWFIRQMSDAVRERDAALAEARERAIRNDWLVSMGSLAAGAAHQLSTPLGTLHLLLDEWREAPELPAALQADLALMQRQVDTCKAALGELTERAGQPRGGAGHGRPLGRWLADGLVAWQALNPAAAMSVALAPELDELRLPLDVSLERALANLLDNARHAGAGQIALRAAPRGGWLVIEIDDDGPGIPPAVLANLASGLPSESAGGLGIGLLLTRAALERRGGRLELQRREAGGTRASLLLPLPPRPEKKHEPTGRAQPADH